MKTDCFEILRRQLRASKIEISEEDITEKLGIALEEKEVAAEIPTEVKAEKKSKKVVEEPIEEPIIEEKLKLK